MMKTRMTKEEKTSFREMLAGEVPVKGITVRELGDRLPLLWTERWDNELSLHQSILYHLQLEESVEIRGGPREKKFIFPRPAMAEASMERHANQDGAVSKMRIDRVWCMSEIDSLVTLESDLNSEIIRLQFELRKAIAKRTAMQEFTGGLDKLLMLGTFTED